MRTPTGAVDGAVVGGVLTASRWRYRGGPRAIRIPAELGATGQLRGVAGTAVVRLDGDSPLHSVPSEWPRKVRSPRLASPSCVDVA